MIDREKVIKWLNDEISDTVVIKRTEPWRDICYRVPVDTLKEFVELLKGQSDILRCKDCKHYKPYTGRVSGNLLHECECFDMDIDDPNWFCANGERRVNQDD